MIETPPATFMVVWKELRYWLFWFFSRKRVAIPDRVADRMRGVEERQRRLVGARLGEGEHLLEGRRRRGSFAETSQLFALARRGRRDVEGGRVVLVKPAQHAVERAVLQHQHDDMFDIIHGHNKAPLLLFRTSTASPLG